MGVDHRWLKSGVGSASVSWDMFGFLIVFKVRGSVMVLGFLGFYQGAMFGQG